MFTKGVETSIPFEAAASSSVDKKQLKTVRYNVQIQTKIWNLKLLARAV